MSGQWTDSDRRSRLPADWPKRVAACKAKALGRCEWKLPSGKRCPRPGTDCDHKRPGDDHSPSNLQWLCGHHHSKKTAREGWTAKAAKKRVRPKKRQESHPGAL